MLLDILSIMASVAHGTAQLRRDIYSLSSIDQRSKCTQLTHMSCYLRRDRKELNNHLLNNGQPLRRPHCVCLDIPAVDASCGNGSVLSNLEHIEYISSI